MLLRQRLEREDQRGLLEVVLPHPDDGCSGPERIVIAVEEQGHVDGISRVRE